MRRVFAKTVPGHERSAFGQAARLERPVSGHAGRQDRRLRVLGQHQAIFGPSQHTSG